MVQPMQNGKLNIMGTFDLINQTELPSRYPSFAVVAVLTSEHEAGLGEHKVEIVVLRPGDKGEATRAGGILTCAPNTGPGALTTVRLVFAINNLPLREYGTHRVSLRVDGEEVGYQPLYVAQPAAAKPGQG
jgi:hypothetical protein